MSDGLNGYIFVFDSRAMYHDVRVLCCMCCLRAVHVRTVSEIEGTTMQLRLQDATDTIWCRMLPHIERGHASA